MLHAALQEPDTTRPIVFIQAALNGAVHAFEDELRLLRETYPNLRAHIRYSAPLDSDKTAKRHDSEGFIDDTLIDAMVGDLNVTYYFCGPAPMLEHVYALLRGRGIPEADLHYEFFGPGGTLAA